jgi:hypothetical protein
MADRMLAGALELKSCEKDSHTMHLVTDAKG